VVPASTSGSPKSCRIAGSTVAIRTCRRHPPSLIVRCRWAFHIRAGVTPAVGISPRRTARHHLREPCPRSVRFEPFATRPRSSVTWPSRRPPYDVIGRRTASPARIGTRRTSSGSTCRPSNRRSADDRYRRAARTLAAWRSDGNSDKDSARRSTSRADLPSPRHRRERTPARILRSAPTGGVGPGSGVLPHERTLRRAARRSLPAAAGDRRQHQPGHRPDTTIVGDLRRRARPVAAGRRRSKSPMMTTSSIAPGTGSRPTASCRPGRDLLRQAASGPITIADGHIVRNGPALPDERG